MTFPFSPTGYSALMALVMAKCFILPLTNWSTIVAGFYFYCCDDKDKVGLCLSFNDCFCYYWGYGNKESLAAEPMACMLAIKVEVAGPLTIFSKGRLSELELI